MSTPPTGGFTPPTTISVLAVHRGQLIAVAILGLVAGLIGLFLPTVALLFVAIVFGIYLVFSGIFRINSSLLAHSMRALYRWLSAILGLLIVAAGVICLADPFGTLIVLAYLIGIGWIAEGLSDFMGAVQGRGGRRAFGFLSGALSIIAGIVIFVIPAAGLTTFVLVGSILLIIVSVSTLLTMPGKPKTPTE